jgi:hypothetical protein
MVIQFRPPLKITPPSEANVPLGKWKMDHKWVTNEATVIKDFGGCQGKNAKSSRLIEFLQLVRRLNESC